MVTRHVEEEKEEVSDCIAEKGKIAQRELQNLEVMEREVAQGRRRVAKCRELGCKQDRREELEVARGRGCNQEGMQQGMPGKSV